MASQQRAGTRGTPERGPRFTSQAHVTLRADSSRNLTEAAVNRVRWSGLNGRRVVLALLGVSTWDAGVAEFVGRVLVDAGAGDVLVQARADVAARFTAEAERGAADYLRAQARLQVEA